MARLNKAQILEAPLRTEEYEVPEWGGSILLGEWPVEQTQQIRKLFESMDMSRAVAEDPAFVVKLFIMGCVDPVFTEADIPELLQKSGMVMTRLLPKIMALNGLSEASQDEARGKS